MAKSTKVPKQEPAKPTGGGLFAARSGVDPTLSALFSTSAGPVKREDRKSQEKEHDKAAAGSKDIEKSDDEDSNSDEDDQEEDDEELSELDDEELDNEDDDDEEGSEDEKDALLDGEAVGVVDEKWKWHSQTTRSQTLKRAVARESEIATTMTSKTCTCRSLLEKKRKRTHKGMLSVGQNGLKSIPRQT